MKFAFFSARFHCPGFPFLTKRQDFYQKENTVHEFPLIGTTTFHSKADWILFCFLKARPSCVVFWLQTVIPELAYANIWLDEQISFRFRSYVECLYPKLLPCGLRDLIMVHQHSLISLSDC